MLAEILTAVSIVGLYIFVIIIRWAQNRRKIFKTFEKLGIPGPKPNFLDGNLNEWKSEPTPNEILTKWLNKYGPVCGYYYGELPIVLISDFEILKQVLVKDFVQFPDRPGLYMETKPLSDGILALKGQRWKTVRSILTPTFSSSKIKLMTKMINKRIGIALSNIDHLSKKSEMFNIHKNLQALTLDVIADCAFAMEVDCQNNFDHPLVLAAQAIINLGHNKAMDYAIKFSFLAPLFRFLGRFTAFAKGADMIVKYVGNQIKIRRNNPNLRRVDMLQLMLEAADEDASSKKSKIHLSDDELIGNALVFLLAGYETTSTALTFTFWLLVTYPEIQEKLFQEVLEHCPNENDEVSYETVHEMKYLDQVFSESMRIFPPVTGFVLRVCVRDCDIGEYVIPKDAAIHIPVWTIHRDPELWPNPDEFDPERFSPENKSSIQPLSFLPFGYGPRNCIGMRFALLEAKLVLARLIRKFQFVPCEKTDKPPLPLVCPGVIINPTNGVFLKAIPRSGSLQ